jgi:hypothetical protein
MVRWREGFVGSSGGGGGGGGGGGLVGAIGSFGDGMVCDGDDCGKTLVLFGFDRFRPSVGGGGFPTRPPAATTWIKKHVAWLPPPAASQLRARDRPGRR